MTRRLSSLAVANLLLAAALIVIGAPPAIDAVLRLPSRATVAALERGSAVEQAEIERARTDLQAAAAVSPGARVNLAFMLMAGEADQAQVGRAIDAFKAYLSEAPGDSRAWAGLAQAELRQDRRAEALSALKMSILTGPSLPGLLLWRCAAGIELYPSLDEDGWRLIAGQFRMAVAHVPDRLVRLVREKRAVVVALALLSRDPYAAQQFSNRLARIQ